VVNRASASNQITKAGKKKIKKVMGEFKKGTLKIGKSKKKVKNPKQAKAIALIEARIKKKEKLKWV